MIHNDEPQDREGRFMLSLGGITAAQLYPARNWQTGWNIPLNNFSFSGMYFISDNQALGVEAGEELFPMYVEDTRHPARSVYSQRSSAWEQLIAIL